MLGEDLRQIFGEQQPLLAVTGAGGLPYWSKLPCLDMLGLNDYYLAHHRPKHMGNGLLGHELGDGEYILRMKPDLILCDLGGSPDPTFSAGKELSQSDVFAREYAQIRMTKRAAPGSPETPFAYVWVRRDSEKIGIRTSANYVTIPAYFFATEALEAFPHDKCLAIAVDAAHPAAICLDDAKTGDWKAEVHGPKPDAVECDIQAIEKGLQIRLTTRQTTPVIVDEVILHR